MSRHKHPLARLIAENPKPLADISNTAAPSRRVHPLYLKAPPSSRAPHDHSKPSRLCNATSIHDPVPHGCDSPSSSVPDDELGVEEGALPSASCSSPLVIASQHLWPHTPSTGATGGDFGCVCPPCAFGVLASSSTKNEFCAHLCAMHAHSHSYIEQRSIASSVYITSNPPHAHTVIPATPPVEPPLSSQHPLTDTYEDGIHNLALCFGNIVTLRGQVSPDTTQPGHTAATKHQQQQPVCVGAHHTWETKNTWDTQCCGAAGVIPTKSTAASSAHCWQHPPATGVSSAAHTAAVLPAATVSPAPLSPLRGLFTINTSVEASQCTYRELTQCTYPSSAWFDFTPTVQPCSHTQSSTVEHHTLCEHSCHKSGQASVFSEAVINSEAVQGLTMAHTRRTSQRHAHGSGGGGNGGNGAGGGYGQQRVQQEVTNDENKQGGGNKKTQQNHHHQQQQQGVFVQKQKKKRATQQADVNSSDRGAIVTASTPAVPPTTTAIAVPPATTVAAPPTMTPATHTTAPPTSGPHDVAALSPTSPTGPVVHVTVHDGCTTVNTPPTVALPAAAAIQPVQVQPAPAPAHLPSNSTNPTTHPTPPSHPTPHRTPVLPPSTATLWEWVQAAVQQSKDSCPSGLVDVWEVFPFQREAYSYLHACEEWGGRPGVGGRQKRGGGGGGGGGGSGGGGGGMGGFIRDAGYVTGCDCLWVFLCCTCKLLCMGCGALFCTHVMHFFVMHVIHVYAHTHHPHNTPTPNTQACTTPATCPPTPPTPHHRCTPHHRHMASRWYTNNTVVIGSTYMQCTTPATTSTRWWWWWSWWWWWEGWRSRHDWGEWGTYYAAWCAYCWCIQFYATTATPTAAATTACCV